MVILANMSVEAAAKQRAGIFGHPNAFISGTMNFSANDGTITRFGWKAQNKSLLMFAGEAYNVEMGISNQLFPQERDETRIAREKPPHRMTPRTFRRSRRAARAGGAV